MSQLNISLGVFKNRLHSFRYISSASGDRARCLYAPVLSVFSGICRVSRRFGVSATWQVTFARKYIFYFNIVLNTPGTPVKDS